MSSASQLLFGSIQGKVNTFPEPELNLIGARFWRVHATSNAGAPEDYVHIGYLKLTAQNGDSTESVSFFAQSGGDLSGNYPASNAFNPSLEEADRWISDTIPGWVGCDFGVSASFEAVSAEITPDKFDIHEQQLPADFTIDYSDDLVTWTTVATFANVLDWEASVTKTFTIQP